MTRRTTSTAAICVVSMAFSAFAVCPVSPPVSARVILRLLETAQKQSAYRILLPGVTGKVHGYEYAVATARNFNVTHRGRNMKFRRYCRRGRKDTIEVHYKISAILSTMWWKTSGRSDNEGEDRSGTFEATVEDVDVSVLFVLRRHHRKGGVQMCAEKVYMDSIVVPTVEAKSFVGDVDASLRHAAHAFFSREVDRLTDGLRKILKNNVFSCAGRIPYSKEKENKKKGRTAQFASFKTGWLPCAGKRGKNRR